MTWYSIVQLVDVILSKFTIGLILTMLWIWTGLNQGNTEVQLFFSFISVSTATKIAANTADQFFSSCLGQKFSLDALCLQARMYIRMQFCIIEIFLVRIVAISTTLLKGRIV